MSEQLTVESFSPHVGATFEMQLDGTRTMALELAEVTDLGDSARGRSGRDGERSPFSIVFRSASTAVLPQGIYHIAHAALGNLELFLVPIGPDAAGMRYEAVFT